MRAEGENFKQDLPTAWSLTWGSIPRLLDPDLSPKSRAGHLTDGAIRHPYANRFLKTSSLPGMMGNDIVQFQHLITNPKAAASF